jgi:putative hemolysin
VGLLIACELRCLEPEQKLVENGRYQVFLARAPQVPVALGEIGRLREEAFRAVGEGTGQDRDLDQYDEWYHHLLVWDIESQEILGAYRLAFSEEILNTVGLHGFYSRSLFEYSRPLLNALGPSIELGRSFVRIDRQRCSRVLAMLWRGIGTVIARLPRYATLFGPVSMSASYSEYSRQLTARVLQQGSYLHPLHTLVDAPRPPGTEQSEATECDTIAELNQEIARAEKPGTKLPTLIEEYQRLGGRFLGFSVDPAFASAMDGLVVVDLRQTPERLLRLYMGSDNYDHFMLAHRSPGSGIACSP